MRKNTTWAMLEVGACFKVNFGINSSNWVVTRPHAEDCFPHVGMSKWSLEMDQPKKFLEVRNHIINRTSVEHGNALEQQLASPLVEGFGFLTSEVLRLVASTGGGRELIIVRRILKLWKNPTNSCRRISTNCLKWPQFGRSMDGKLSPRQRPFTG